jgi:ubiquinol-cytochrome c reductase iron-sulfur subunit
MFKMSKKRKHIHILDGMSLYTRDRSPFYWGYLNIEGNIYKKSLKTTDRKEAERLLFVWKNEIFADSLNLIDADDEEDHHHTKQKPIVDEKRRKALLITSGLMGAVTVAAFAVPFLSAWKPSEKAKALGASVKFDLSKLQPGAMAIVEWRRTPIFVVHQTQEAIDNLPKLNEKVTNQANEVLPSNEKKFTVLKGVCTHLSCAPKYHPEIEPKAWDQEWLGGFFCPCHGSKFDLAGRVYKGVPAPINLEIPPHKFSGNTLIIGEAG